jgi:hypothetical protein
MAVRIQYARILSICLAVILIINVCVLGACFMVQLGPVALQTARPAPFDLTPSSGLGLFGRLAGDSLDDSGAHSPKPVSVSRTRRIKKSLASR